MKKELYYFGLGLYQHEAHYFGLYKHSIFTF